MRVVVVGAGFAGLRTAMLLERAGHEVLVYEARDRVGGRARSVSLDSGWYEAGGEWIDADHFRVLSLLKELDLDAEESHQYPGRILYRGEFCAENNLWPEAQVDVAKLQSCSLGVPQFYDTLGSFLDDICVSERGRWVAEATLRSDEGDDTHSVGFEAWHHAFRNYSSREGGEMGAYRFGLGAERVCDEMAKRLRQLVVLQKGLTGVQQAEDHVELWFKDEIAVADACVLALPVGCYKVVDFGESLTPDMEDLLNAYSMARAIKVSVEFEPGSWIEGSPRVISDLAFMQCWDGGRGGALVLNCYICGDEADRLRLSESLTTEIQDAIGHVWPHLAKRLKEVHLTDWIGDQYATGAFGLIGKSNPQVNAEKLWSSQERVHFAGEWCSTWNGFYEGALESAERVVKELSQ